MEVAGVYPIVEGIRRLCARTTRPKWDDARGTVMNGQPDVLDLVPRYWKKTPTGEATSP